MRLQRSGGLLMLRCFVQLVLISGWLKIFGDLK